MNRVMFRATKLETEAYLSRFRLNFNIFFHHSDAVSVKLDPESYFLGARVSEYQSATREVIGGLPCAYIAGGGRLAGRASVFLSRAFGRERFPTIATVAPISTLLSKI